MLITKNDTKYHLGIHLKIIVFFKKNHGLNFLICCEIFTIFMKSTIGLVICEIVKVKKLYVEIQLLDTWENTWKQ